MGNILSRNKKERTVKLPDETVIIKRMGFSIGKKISEGEFGIIREASHPDQRFPLIVNILMATYANDRRRLRSEHGTGRSQPDLDIVSRMIHPNIVKIFQIIRTNERLFLFIEKVEHGDVFEYIRLNEKIDTNLGKNITFGLANAVSYLHSVGIAHNNIRCDNILLDSAMNARLTDFTHASPCLDASTGLPVRKMTLSGQGTPEYSAPEILRLEEYDLKKCDSWSVGVCVFMILTRTVPFDQTRLDILTGLPTRAQHYIADLIAGHVPSECQRLVGNLLEPDSEQRLSICDIFEDQWFSNHMEPHTITTGGGGGGGGVPNMQGGDMRGDMSGDMHGDMRGDMQGVVPQ